MATYINEFLFGFYPYLCMVVYFLGSWARFDRSQYTWRAQSSQFLRRRQLMWGSILFHVGILLLFFGHFFGLLTPPEVYTALGLTVKGKQLLAVVAGGIFAVVCFIGMTMLIHRRLFDPRIRLTSKRTDIFILLFIYVQLIIGMAGIPYSLADPSGGMASALAHEISQPMTAARALARSAQQLINGGSSDIDRVNSNLASLVAQIDHAADVIRRMREFLRRGEPHLSTLHMATVLEDALILARPEAAIHDARISLEIDPALPAVFGDRIQLQQVVLNLVRNAIDAIVEAGVKQGRVAVRAFPGEAGRTVEVSVADNGTGIASDRDLFTPLSSSKKDGLGLGLSICANIVHAHGGRIWLQSGASGATEFRFSLPLQPET